MSAGAEHPGTLLQAVSAAFAEDGPLAIAQARFQPRAGLAQQLRHGAAWTAQRCAQRQDGLADRLPKAVAQGVARQAQRLDHAALRLELLDPRLVLQRGYALLTDSEGLPVTRTAQVRTGDAVRAAVSDGEIDLTVSAPRLL
ncbi:exodeoxyribonuclease VII large subunit [Paracidovorax avenae]|uniref:exodeoxyribonuclease VII large subunit n=1 Tax=Paracidovorax oryzae TaxID=862720 RepID=UPI0003677CB0